GADDRVACCADTGLTRVHLGASVAVAASRSVRDGRVQAEPGGAVARSRRVALVGCGAGDFYDDANTVVAVIVRAGVVVARSEGRRAHRADADVGVAGARLVAPVERRADDRVAARADAAPTGVRARARVTVVAGAPVRNGRVRAQSCRGIARPRRMT